MPVFLLCGLLSTVGLLEFYRLFRSGLLFERQGLRPAAEAYIILLFSMVIFLVAQGKGMIVFPLGP